MYYICMLYSKYRIGGNHMKQEEKKFKELLKKRIELSQKNKSKVEKVSAKDSQLKDIIKNFSESKDYKKI